MAKLKFIVTIDTTEELGKVIASACSLQVADAVAKFACAQDGVRCANVFTDYARKADRVCHCLTTPTENGPVTQALTPEAQEYGG